jgi:hypothetical protein
MVWAMKLKDNRSIEERIAYRSYVGLLPRDHDSAAYQEGWDAAREGKSGKDNPYKLSVYCKKAKQKQYEDGSMSNFPDKYSIRGGKERMDNMLLWMYGYNAWVEMFGSPHGRAGWVYK